MQPSPGTRMALVRQLPDSSPLSQDPQSCGAAGAAGSAMPERCRMVPWSAGVPSWLRGVPLRLEHIWGSFTGEVRAELS